MRTKFKRIKSLILILLLTLMMIPTNIKITKAEALDTDIVTFPDANLEAAVREKLGKASGYITVDDMKSMTGKLTARNKNISDLSGLEHAINITELDLWYNQITDITPLKNITNLQLLDLGDNQITDITPLKDIIKLTELNLSRNQVNDISSLKNMKNLEILALYNNQISDITSLKDMVSLQALWLSNNQISDITPLKDMRNLAWLRLEGNQISDITPLKNMASLMILNLGDNQITDIAALSNMTSLFTLTLENNKIKSIPNFIGNFSMLQFLDLRNNCLTGEIEPFLGNLTNLIYSNKDETHEATAYTSFSGNYLTGTVPAALKNRLEEEAFYNNLLEGENNQKQLTLIDGAELNLSLNSSVSSNTLKGITYLYEGEDSHSKSLYELELLPVDESFFDENGRAIKSGSTTAYIKLKDVADSNPYAKTLTPVQVNISDKIGSNNDITIEFSINNTLEVTLGTNNINFGTVSSIGGEVETTTLTVTSSLPYDISTKAYSDFIGNSDSSNIIPIEKVSLDVDNLGYMELSKGKVLNLGNNPSAIDKIHNINFKIGNTMGYKKDNYRAELQFIIDTK